ncbi:MAG TPA: hypothetical protein VGR27_12625 [Longimicrobiaceae bacterium]|nr:hypothetical protein [Longimicrobiaceae bacterium]
MVPPRRPTHHDEERRRVFRRMEWVFVYAPPLLALFFTVFGATFLAWLVAIPGTGFWQRWLVLVAIIIGPALVWQGIQWWRDR